MSDYKLEISEITMQTQSGGIVHTEHEAFTTERVIYYARVDNDTDQFLGPFTVHFLIDGAELGYGGMSHQGLESHSSQWFDGSTDQLAVGEHTLHIKIEPEDGAPFEGGEQIVRLIARQPASNRRMDEGEPGGSSAWAQRQVYLVVRDFRGAGLNGDAYVVFSGQGGEHASRGQIVDGDLSLDGAYVPNHGGTIQLTIVTQQFDGMQLKGTFGFDVKDEQVRKTLFQEKQVVKLSGSQARTYAEQLSVTGSYGVDFKVISAGAEITAQTSTSHTWTEGIEHEFWIPQTVLTDNESGAARTH